MKSFFAIVVMLICCATTSSAATIQATTPPDGVAMITITGEFGLGDEITFNNLAIPLKQAIVVLDSPGGKAFPAMEIGRTISIKGFATAALPGGLCTSACALTWLAGKPRVLFPTSRVGFHAIYILGDGTTDVSSTGNALVGQYLQQLGLNTSAIIFATSAPPEGMNWLNEEQARAIGLDVKMFAENQATTNADRAQRNTTNTEVSGMPPVTPPVVARATAGPVNWHRLLLTLNGGVPWR